MENAGFKQVLSGFCQSACAGDRYNKHRRMRSVPLFWKPCLSKHRSHIWCQTALPGDGKFPLLCQVIAIFADSEIGNLIQEKKDVAQTSVWLALH